MAYGLADMEAGCIEERRESGGVRSKLSIRSACIFNEQLLRQTSSRSLVSPKFYMRCWIWSIQPYTDVMARKGKSGYVTSTDSSHSTVLADGVVTRTGKV